MKVLVQFELLPEEMHMYLIENPTEVELENLKLAHGVFMNACGYTQEQNDAIEWVSDWLVDKNRIYDKDKMHTPIGPVDDVFYCGFIL